MELKDLKKEEKKIDHLVKEVNAAIGSALPTSLHVDAALNGIQKTLQSLFNVDAVASLQGGQSVESIINLIRNGQSPAAIQTITQIFKGLEAQIASTDIKQQGLMRELISQFEKLNGKLIGAITNPASVGIGLIPRDDLAPMVILPGLGGTSLDFCFDADKYCPCDLKECDDITGKLILRLGGALYVNFLALVLNKTCIISLLEPKYDHKDKTLNNVEGLHTKIHGNYLGDTNASDYLGYILDSDIGVPGTNYAHNFIDYFQKYGYTTGHNLFAAGYDFRLVPYRDHRKEYFCQVKKIVKKAYEKNHRKKVYLVGHSLGGQLVTMFLNAMKCSWKKKYVAGFIAISPAFDGGAKGLRTILSGDNFGFPTAIAGTNADWAGAERMMAGVLATVPLHAEMYGTVSGTELTGDGTAVVLSYPASGQPNKVYNVNDYKDKDGIIGILEALADDTNTPSLKDSASILRRLRHERETNGWDDPGVQVYMLIITTNSTENGAYVYDMDNGGIGADPIGMVNSPGDATVPFWGMTIPNQKNWKKVHTQVFPSYGGELNHYSAFVNQSIYDPVVPNDVFDAVRAIVCPP